MAGNQHLISFIQRAIGYSLTGSTSEQVLFIPYGVGANGKSTLIETVNAMLGDYAQTASSSLLLTKRNDGVPNDVARLAGSRFVASAENDAGRHVAEALVKRLTGGDKVSARFLFNEFFDFYPQCKFFLSTNHRPRIRGTDKGIWRRIRLIPFNVVIPDEQQDKQLKEKLLAELPGILAWAVRGCLAWQREGLGMPPEVSDATESYRQESDVLGQFIAERCIQKAGITTSAGALYKEYLCWCNESGEEPLPQRDFGMQLTERGFPRDRTGKTRLRVGIGLVTEVTGSDPNFGKSSEFGGSGATLPKPASHTSHTSPAEPEPVPSKVEVEI
jgi:putative DNA primase/helicase